MPEVGGWGSLRIPTFHVFVLGVRINRVGGSVGAGGLFGNVGVVDICSSIVCKIAILPSFHPPLLYRVSLSWLWSSVVCCLLLLWFLLSF